jgi:hypothetical protein
MTLSEQFKRKAWSKVLKKVFRVDKSKAATFERQAAPSTKKELSEVRTLVQATREDRIPTEENSSYALHDRLWRVAQMNPASIDENRARRWR